MLLAGVSVTVASCNKGRGPPEPDQATPVSADPKASLAAKAPVPPSPGGPSEARAALAALPGMDFSTLPPAAQQELATVFSDDFCYCGCPHSLGACLKGHPTCRHARKMAQM